MVLYLTVKKAKFPDFFFGLYLCNYSFFLRYLKVLHNKFRIKELEYRVANKWRLGSLLGEQRK